MGRFFGWLPDVPDHRDHVYQHKAALRRVQLPRAVDLRTLCPPIQNQGDLGSCTANAVAALVDMERRKQKRSMVIPSRLFLYYGARELENDIVNDSGAFLRDAFKVAYKSGICPESTWPYIISKFATRPTAKCYTEAAKRKARSYQRVAQTLDAMRVSLANNQAFAFGFMVYESFDSEVVARTGIVPMPGRNESDLGGHAVACVGYDNAKKSFLCRNSWGSWWGVGGYFWMPFDYVLNPDLSCDFWSVTLNVFT